VQNVLVKLADIFEVDAVKESDILRDFESWDSLSALSILAMADSSFGIHMTAQDLRAIKTVADLLAFFDKNKK